jgi:hypothetical protein
LNRAALLPLIAAAMALSHPARADIGDWRAPFVDIKAFGAGGVSATASHRATSAELVRSGWPALPSATPVYELGFGLAVLGWSIDLHIHGSDLSFQDRAGSPLGLEYHRGWLGVELGYRLWLNRSLSLSPHLGLASLTSTLCFAGHPSSASPTSRPPFQQILANPGRETCLDASALGADVGFSPAWNFRFPFDKKGGDKKKGDALGIYLSVGPRFGYSLPFSSTRTWGEKNATDHRKEFRPFQGPMAPLGEAYAGIELQFHFVAETLDLSPSSAKAR